MSCPAPGIKKAFLDSIDLPKVTYNAMKDKIKEHKRVMILVKMEGRSMKTSLLTNVDEYAKTLPKIKEVFNTYKTESEIPFLIMEQPHVVIQIYQIGKLSG